MIILLCIYGNCSKCSINLDDTLTPTWSSSELHQLQQQHTSVLRSAGGEGGEGCIENTFTKLTNYESASR